MTKITSLLKEALGKRLTIIGIGNRLRQDDGFGSLMIERLKGKTHATLIDAGNAPESYLGSIIKSKPDIIIILDTADLGISPGGIDILAKSDILEVGFSTHDSSPRMFMTFLEESLKAEIFMIALKPKNMQFGEGLSEEAIRGMDELERIFVDLGKETGE